MDAIRRLLLLVATAALLLAVAVGPSFATEGGGEGATTGGEEGREKVELPDRPRDQVGLILLGIGGLLGLLALDNARRQLKGERKQATGEWRWR